MSRILTSLVTLSGLSAFILARADVELPLQKPGLWETHVQRTIMGRKQDTVAKVCMTNDVQKKVRAMADNINKQDACTASTTRTAPNTYVTERRCTTGLLAGSVIRSTMTFASDGVIHGEVHTQRGSMDSVTVQDSRYLGSCPSDMAPGDSVLDNGMKTNLLSPGGR
jgi:hypothetical protein